MSITDALGRVAFRYDYDLAQRPLHTFGIDNGDRWVVPDALGQAVAPVGRQKAHPARVRRSEPARATVGQGPCRRDADLAPAAFEYGDGGDPAQPT